jgi:hypothetical protein
MHAGAEGLVAGAGGERHEDPAVLGVPAAECLDGRPESPHGSLLAPAGAIPTQPEPTAFGGDGPVSMAVVTRQDAEWGATPFDFVGQGGET